MEGGMARREVVVGEWTLAITASPDGAGLQVEALRRTPSSASNTNEKAALVSGCEDRVAVCVADVEGTEATVLPANKVWFGVGRRSGKKRPATSGGDDVYDPTDDGLQPTKKRRRSDSTAEPTLRRPASDDEYSEEEAKRAHNDDLETDESEDHEIDVALRQLVVARSTPQQGESEEGNNVSEDVTTVKGDEEDGEPNPRAETYDQDEEEGGDLCFTMMPAEVQLRVFSKLTPHEISRVGAVCRQWRILSQDTALWRDHVNSLYGTFAGPGAYYRDIYIQTALGMKKIQQIYAASLKKAQFCLSVRRLAFACRCGAVRWVEKLLDGLTVKKVKQLLCVGLPLENLTPFMIAVKHRHKGVVDLLLPYLASEDGENDAAELREASAMEGDGSDFTIYDRWNNLLEALTIAISSRDVGTALRLIGAGADVAATNCFQQAIYKGDAEMVRFLLANGADMETQLFLKDYIYATPLIFAIEMENREIVQLLLEAGADPNARCAHMPYGAQGTQVNVTALSVAVGRCNLEMAGLLLAQQGRLERANWEEALELAKEQLLDVASEERGHLIMFSAFREETEHRHAKWVAMVKLLRDHAHSAIFLDDPPQDDDDDKPACVLM